MSHILSDFDPLDFKLSLFKNGTVLQTKRKQFGKPSKKIKSINKEKFLICFDPLLPPYLGNKIRKFF